MQAGFREPSRQAVPVAEEDQWKKMNVACIPSMGLAVAGIAGRGLAGPAPTEPLLDIHQHTNYSGRTDQELVAHQALHEVTTTVLLPGAGWMLSEVGDNP